MRTDTIYQQLRSHLAYLKLGAAADALAPALEQAERDQPGYTQFLCDLLAVEVAATEQRRLEGRLRFAKLPAPKTLEQFDFDAQPSLDRRLVDDLATLRFVEERANVLLIGPPGVGKTHLAIALGHRAVHAGYRVYYTTAADLVARTSRAALEGRWATTMRFWNGPQLLIIDELGYLPMPGEAASHLFQVISRPLRTRLDRPDHQPRHRRLGTDLRRHHRRRRRPGPPPAPRHSALDHRRQLPHAPPPRSHRRPQARPHRPARRWGILMIEGGELR
jgi:DNA replication protein DnaC